MVDVGAKEMPEHLGVCILICSWGVSTFLCPLPLLFFFLHYPLGGGVTKKLEDEATFSHVTCWLLWNDKR